MTTTYIAGSNNTAQTGTLNYFPVNAIYNGHTRMTTESSAEVVFPCAGTITEFKGQVSVAPGSGNIWALTLRKNGADSDLSFLISDSETSGSDTGSVTVAAGDRFCIETDPFSFPNAARIDWFLTFESTTTDETPVLSQGYYLGTSGVYLPLSGGMTTSSNTNQVTETRRHNIIPTAGDITAVEIRLGAAPTSGKSYTFELIEGFAGSQTVLDSWTISDTDTTASESGLSIGVAAGDNLTLKVTDSGNPAAVDYSFSWCFKSTAGGESLILLSHYVPTSYIGVQGTGRITASTFANTAQPIGPSRITKLAAANHDANSSANYDVETDSGVWSDSLVDLNGSEKYKIVTLDSADYKTFGEFENAAWAPETSSFGDGSFAMVAVNDTSSDVTLGTISVAATSTVAADVTVQAGTTSLGTIAVSATSTVSAEASAVKPLGAVAVAGTSTVAADVSATKPLGAIAVAASSSVAAVLTSSSNPIVTLGTIAVAATSTVTAESSATKPLGTVAVAGTSSVTADSSAVKPLGAAAVAGTSSVAVSLGGVLPVGTVAVAGSSAASVAKLNANVSLVAAVAATSTMAVSVSTQLAPYGTRVRKSGRRPDVTVTGRRRRSVG